MGPLHTTIWSSSGGRKGGGKVAAAIFLPLVLVLLWHALVTTLWLDIVLGVFVFLAVIGAVSERAERRRSNQ